MTPRLSILAAALALAACNNGQPRVFRVAMDLSALDNIKEPTCWKSGQPPNPTTTESLTNLYTEQQWVVWDSVSSEQDPSPKEFLDLGHQAFKLGDSPAVDFDDVIGTTTAASFTGRRSKTSTVPNQFVQVRQTTLTVKFSDLGMAPVGSMIVEAEYACVPQGGTCPSMDFVADPMKCTVTLPFSARRIDVSRVAGYTEEPKGQ